MQAEEAITRLSNALAIISQQIDKEAVRTLKEIVDEKHWHYIEQGLQTNNKSLIMHGIIGAMSHYEAEREKEKFEKKIRSITPDT